jgi:hypothetical protein
MFKFELGIELKDKVTGFKGFVIGRADYLTGCNQYALQPKMSKGKWEENKWLDENRLSPTKALRVELKDAKKNPGADITPPKI